LQAKTNSVFETNPQLPSFIFIEAGDETVRGGVDNDHILGDSGLGDQIGDDPSEGETDTHLHILFLSLFTHIYACVDVCPQILSFRNSYANYYYSLECEKVDNYVGCPSWSYEGFFFL
jgi:hypothetical protein